MKIVLEEKTVLSDNNTAAWLLHLNISLKLLTSLHLLFLELHFAHKPFS